MRKLQTDESVTDEQKSETSTPTKEETPDETLCAATEETASLDTLLKLARSVPMPCEGDEQQWAGLLSRVQDLSYIRMRANVSVSGHSEADRPKTLGPFELLERLGEGGMGTVYRARHRRLGKLMAVKVMHSHRIADHELRARFDREMRALGQLSHPNIVLAQHADEVEGVPYLAMEYVDGITLSSLFGQLKAAEKPLPIAVVCELIRQAAEGIQYAHDHGVLHRDLKPGNLILDFEGRVRVLDLGLARMTETIGLGGSSENGEHLTSQHQILGTPGYMAPEQLTREHETDSRTDVYALAATAFFLLTGKRPHAYSSSESIVQHAMRVVAEPVPDLKNLRSDVPVELAHLIAHALEREPAQRLQTAAELARGLSRWAGVNALTGLLHRLRSDSEADSHCEFGTGSPAEQMTPDVHAAKAATLIMPASSAVSRGSDGRNLISAWRLPAAFFAIILLSGVLLRLRTNDGGELIIQSDDPNAKISISAVQGDTSEELKLVEQDDHTLKLTQGRWSVQIEGPEASGFELSADSIVVSPGSRHEIRVSRRKGDESLAMAEAPRKPDTTSSAGKGRSSHGESVLEPPERNPDGGGTSGGRNHQSSFITANGNVDWTPGRLDRIGWGLVPQPADFDPVATWQMQLLRPPTGMGGSHDVERLAHLDPQGELLGTCDEYGARILRIRDGRVLQYFQQSDGDSYTSIAFSPDGSYVMLSTMQRIEVRRRDGRLISRFVPGNQFFQYPHSHLRTIWTPAGNILAWTRSGAAIFKTTAEVLDEIIVHDEARDAWLEHAAANSAGNEILFSGLGKSVFKWTIDETPGNTELVNVLTVNDASACQAFWSPSGRQILVTPEGGESLPRIFSADGTLQVTGKLPMYLAAWSPDERFLVDGYRRVFSSETLELLRTLELPEMHTLRDDTFKPFWPATDQIVMISQSEYRLYASGSVFHFHPSGRLTGSLELPQLLSVGSATLAEDGGVRTAHLSSFGLCGLGQWEESGRPLGVSFTDGSQHSRDGGFPWNPVNGHLAIANGAWGPVKIVNQAGQTVRSIPVRGTQLAWSGDGKRLSMIDYSVEPYGAVTVFGESDVPEFVSEPLSAYNSSTPTWSSDGRWLCWSTPVEIASQPGELSLVDMHSDDRIVQKIALPHAIGSRWISYSPDSQWLAVLSHVPPKQSAFLLRMSDLSTFEQCEDDETTAANASAGLWSADSHRVILGHLYEVDPVQGLRKTGNLRVNAFRSQLLAFTPDNRGIWTESPLKRTFGVRDLDGQQLLEFAASGPLRPGHPDPIQARNHSSDRLVFLAEITQYRDNPVATGLLNLKEPGTRWIGLAWDDGQQMTLGPAGEILHGPESVDKYVIHTIDYPGGVTTAVTRQQILDRAAASPEQKAVLWASDLKADIRINDELNVWVAPPDPDLHQYPEASKVQELNFSGHLQIADEELQYLSQFSGLNSLNLAKTSTSTAPDLSSLTHLKELDLSDTQITSLTGLQNAPSLRRLELSGLKLDAFAWPIIGSLTTLERLNLNDTPLDSLSMLDLLSLKNLKYLDVRNTKLTESDLAALRTAFPDCRVLSAGESE